MIINKQSEITLGAWLLKPLAIQRVKYLQRKYRKLSIYHSTYGGQSNQVLAKLKLLQHQLYYYKSQFDYWGYFYPNCVGNDKHDKFYSKLFPIKDFPEVDNVVWHNPEAVTYYHNKIWNLRRGKSTQYPTQIEKTLRKYKKWN